MEGFDILDRRFKRFILDNASLEELASGFRWIEGPVWMGDADCLLFQDLPNDRTMRWSERHGVSVYRAPSHYANGQTRDREGRLVACSHRNRCLYRTEHDGTLTKLVDCHAGKRLNAPNDVVVKSDGTIWFTDPLYGIATDYEGGCQASEQPPALYCFDPARGDIRVMASDFDGPNGLAFSPDERRLYVSETGDQTTDTPRQYIRAFAVEDGGRALSSTASIRRATCWARSWYPIAFRISPSVGCGRTACSLPARPSSIRFS
jgi:gluconolactonase